MPSPPNTAYENHVQVLPFPAGQDFTALGFNFPIVTLNALGQAIVAQPGARAVGIALNNPPAVGTVDVGTYGVGRATASEAIGVGDLIAVGTGGRARKAVDDDNVIGMALSAAAGSGIIFACLILNQLDGQNGGGTTGLVAGVDLSAQAGRAAKFDGAGAVIPASVAGENCIGFINAGVANAQPVTVQQYGTLTNAVAGVAITRGTKLSTDNQGRVIVAATGNHVLGIAMASQAVVGSPVKILVTLGGAPLP